MDDSFFDICCLCESRLSRHVTVTTQGLATFRSDLQEMDETQRTFDDILTFGVFYLIFHLSITRSNLSITDNNCQYIEWHQVAGIHFGHSCYCTRPVLLSNSPSLLFDSRIEREARQARFGSFFGNFSKRFSYKSKQVPGARTWSLKSRNGWRATRHWCTAFFFPFLSRFPLGLMALWLSYDNTVLKHCMMFWYLDMLCYYCCSLWFGVVACCCCGTHLTVTIHQLQDIASADADESLNIRQEADSTKRWIQNQCTTYTSSRDFQRPYKFWSQGPKTLFRIEVFGRTAALWDQVWGNILSDRIDSQGNTSKAIALIWKWFHKTLGSLMEFLVLFTLLHGTSRLVWI